MPTAHSTARLFSLRAPIGTESERALFQRRLALALYVIFGLSFGFWLLQLGATAVIFRCSPLVFLSARSVQIHLATTLVALAVSLCLRRGKPSARVLDAADVATSLGLCAGWAAMIYLERTSGPPEARMELIALLATSYTLATRAALIPSTPARSALVGIGAMAPLVPLTFLLSHLANPGMSAAGPTVHVSIWAALGIACTTTISRVIYGLQLQVRKAMQLGQYLLEDKIGEGGMGVVYRASHAMLRRPTAIKLLTGSTGRAAERFEREVQITARLTHPNTVAVFDYGRTPDGVFYYAMEYLDGLTLQDLVTEFGSLPPSRTVHILLQMCGALEEAHANGLVHRDIKPANVMLTERGGVPDVVKVLDFGLVKESANVDASVTNASAILGTPHYMAPEAIVDPFSVDARTDLYAVGATAYFLLTGGPVFDGVRLIEVCSQHLYQTPEPPSSRCAGIPERLEEVILACLSKRPADRPTGAAELADLLRAGNASEWTRQDARDWWSHHSARATASRARARERERGARSGSKATFSKTVAVALDSRGAA
jgi:eukaryotic-like serine/threonine-protein kinase